MILFGSYFSVSITAGAPKIC